MTMSNNSSLPWADCDTGFLDSDGIAIRKCSTEFLSTLCTAYMDCIADDKIHVQDSSANQLFERVMDELRRLSSSPTLFPSTETQTRFWSLLTHAIDTQVTAAQSKIDEEMRADFLMRANLLAREEDRLLQSLNRPSYKPDLLPWEQFLLRGSPGCGVRLPHTTPNATLQLMPIGGVALHLRWMRDRHLTAAKCEGSVLPEVLPGIPSTLQQTKPYQCAELPSSGLEYEHTWKYSALPREANVTDRLENFNDVIEALEGEELMDFSRARAGIKAMYYHSRNPDMI
ncbi:hypothetical protein BDDG_01748 [Blastomyces dermatitidis ATCC 18188]|uniref:Uncharacterized protein n=1 Tax=Ajellomyces dermatitidis (strain ATCC 18188 / CBS 674.68) TaxID=653446 RepID=F2T6J7_AJEDA|nr:hypothetical protein BDDG_01748 [Blastomyces dermatitidis ATCC 18188]